MSFPLIWGSFMALLVAAILLIAWRGRVREQCVRRFALDLGLTPFAPGVPAGIFIARGVRIVYCYTGSCRGVPVVIFRKTTGIGKFAYASVVLGFESTRPNPQPPPASLGLKGAEFKQNEPWTIVTLAFRGNLAGQLQSLLDLYC